MCVRLVWFSTLIYVTNPSTIKTAQPAANNLSCPVYFDIIIIISAIWSLREHYHHQLGVMCSSYCEYSWQLVDSIRHTSVIFFFLSNKKHRSRTLKLSSPHNHLVNGLGEQPCFKSLVPWFSDTLIRWYPDPLILWYSDHMIPWYPDTLDTLIPRCSDTLILWFLDALMLWYSDTIILWYSDTPTLWYSDMPVLWNSGSIHLILWYSDTVMIWWADDLMVWYSHTLILS